MNMNENDYASLPRHQWGLGENNDFKRVVHITRIIIMFGSIKGWQKWKNNTLLKIRMLKYYLMN